MNMHSAARFRLPGCISGRLQAKVGCASRGDCFRTGWKPSTNPGLFGLSGLLRTLPGRGCHNDRYRTLARHLTGAPARA